MISQQAAVTYLDNRYGASFLNTRYDNTLDDGRYLIQLYEVNSQGHTVTYDWFYVNPETGDYTSMYGKEGAIPLG